MANSKSKEVATKSKGSAMTFGDFEGMAGRGLENVTSDTLVIPRLAVLQDLSPQVKPNKPEYIESAKAGLFCDVTMGKVYGSEIILVPIDFSRVWVEWAPRSTGGGLIEIHPDDPGVDQMEVNGDGKPVNEAGNIISETYQFYFLMVDMENGTVERKFFPMSSSLIKRAKRLLTLATSITLKGKNGYFTPPFFYAAYRAHTSPESGPKGDWYTCVFETEAPIAELEGIDNELLYNQAVEFYNSIAQGEVQGDVSTDETPASGGSGARAESEQDPM